MKFKIALCILCCMKLAILCSCGSTEEKTAKAEQINKRLIEEKIAFQLPDKTLSMTQNISYNGDIGKAYFELFFSDEDFAKIESNAKENDWKTLPLSKQQQNLLEKVFFRDTNFESEFLASSDGYYYKESSNHNNEYFICMLVKSQNALLFFDNHD